MCSLEQYKINLKGLVDEVTSLDYDLDDSYFTALDSSELEHGVLHVSGSIRKATGFFELLLHVEGTVAVACDRCLDNMDQSIMTDQRLIVKLGIADSEEDETIVVEENEGILDLSWFIYELIVLAIPIKHVHAPGKCNPAMSQVLEELSTDRSSDEESSQPIDPRWNKLATLNIKD
jgi:uncharacterized metal-binding protein YceD (DUF177 family)